MTGDHDAQLRESEEAAAAEWNRRRAELAGREPAVEAERVVRGPGVDEGGEPGPA